MKKLLKKLIKLGNLSRNSISPLVTISISRSSLLSNLNEFRSIAPNRQVAPVLKSNAYGHGLILVANELKNQSIPFFVIDSYFEAKALRNEGISTPLLIIGYSTTDSIVKNNLKDICFTITSLDSLKELSKKIKKQAHIHLKIDTGMHRQGISFSEKEEASKIIKNNTKIILDGICSHFSDADNSDMTFTNTQIKTWNYSVEYFKDQFPALKYWHISASVGHIYKEAEANITRLGIGLYGLINFNGLKLKPILEMKTIITGIKQIKNGDSVGYNKTFISAEDATIATIPVGYNEGVDRRLSNKGFVKMSENSTDNFLKNEILKNINSDFFCKIVGRVSMNITTIDVSKIKNIKIGDEVTVFSSNKNDLNSIENVSKYCNSIAYEMAVHLPQYLRRIVIK